MPKMKKKSFLGRNNKNRYSAFRKFLFHQNIVCFDWIMNLFLSSVMFSAKKVSFPAKTDVIMRQKTELLRSGNLSWPEI